jgi:hypothetical protein
MNGEPVQLVHGLTLRGDIPVPAAGRPDDAAVDFDVRLEGPTTLSSSAPAGQVVAALDRPGAGYAATLRGDLVTVRFYETAEFEVDMRGGTIVARPAPGGGEAMIPVLLAGNVLAIVLGLRGSFVLHASAVELGGAAIAFAGPSGAGKSTVAALLCAAGGAIVGDDTAHVEMRDGVRVVHHGPHELRLRPQAAALADGVSGDVSETADGRLAVDCRAAGGVTTRLGAIALPRRPADAGGLTARRLGPRQSLEALLRCPRVTGWQTPAPLRLHFDACARIAEELPVFGVDLPTASLGDPGLPGALREALADAGALGPAARDI